MSTSVLALHRAVQRDDDPVPTSFSCGTAALPAETVAAVLAELGPGMALGPRAGRRPPERTHADSSSPTGG